MKQRLSLLLSLGYFAIGQGICLTPAIAQVAPDGTTNTTVDVSGNDFTIQDGDRAGDNLFHSFSDFSVPTDGSAFFNNAADIVNIFSRVTGGNISNIDGLLRANGTANLFLINPAGIIFGESARLSLGGSFYGSTADSIVFPDGEFSATNLDNPPILTINAPIGLNFRDNPGDIVNRSFVQNSAGEFVGLEIKSGNSLTLVGGNINFESGEATARGGNIELGGLSQAGTVTLNDDGSLSFPDDVAKADITLSNAADVDVSGTGGGSITINARNLNVTTDDFIPNSNIRAGITADSTSPEAQAGDITINVDNNILVDASVISNQVGLNAIGNAGNINITTGNLTLTNGGIVNADIFGNGNGGSINIAATDSVNVDGERFDIPPDTVVSRDEVTSRIASRARSEVEVDAGDINITTGNLNLTHGGIIQSSQGNEPENLGNAGSIKISAIDTITIDGEASDTFPSAVASEGDLGNAGDISINTSNLILTNGGLVNASTFGTGNGGSVNITATDTIAIDGETSVAFPSGVGSQGNIGDSGDIDISTSNLILTNGGAVNNGAFGTGNGGSVNITATDTIIIDGETSDTLPSGVSSQGNIGDAGDVTIKTSDLILTNGGQLSAITFGTGNGGSVNITATDTITIDGETSVAFPSVISSQGITGDAGDIDINTSNLILTNGGFITTSTVGEGNAGSINISASDTITIDGEDSEAFPSVIGSQGNIGDGGDITINTGNLILINGGRVSVDTFEEGNAGSININVRDNITIDGETSDAFSGGIFSQGEIGNGGDLTISTGNLILTNGGQISTDAFGEGNAGSIIINARESINIVGVSSFEAEPSSIISQGLVSSGNGGDINVVTDRLTINDGATIAAGNFDRAGIFEPGTGEPGNVNIEANSLDLTNQASIETTTQSETGNRANINLQIADNLILRDNSFISAQAFNNANGGNITIANDFIIAFPNQNNDIIASAQQGEGGNINITAEALFGIEERPLNDITNDINASSEFGLDGTIVIATPDVNPLQRDLEEPANIIESEQTIGQSCRSTSTADKPSGLTLKGKGGVPPVPTETFNSESILGDEPNNISNLQTQHPEIQPIKTSIGDIYPARGVIKTGDGKIILTAYTTDNLNTRTLQIEANCK